MDFENYYFNDVILMMLVLDIKYFLMYNVGSNIK